MLTEKTLVAIELLDIIGNGNAKEGVSIAQITSQCAVHEDVVRAIVGKLVLANLVRFVDSAQKSVALTKSRSQISLLELLLSIDEELQVLHPKNKNVQRAFGSSSIGITFTTIETFVKTRLSNMKITDILAK